MDGAPVSEAAVLAEFAALREEIISLAEDLRSLYNFHLVSAGAVLSYALAVPQRRPAAIVLSMSTYLLYARIQNGSTALLRIGQYIRTVLYPKLAPGSMEWEDWAIDHVRVRGAVVRTRFHEEITYLGVPALGLALAGTTLVQVESVTWTWAATFAAWGVGVVFTGLTLGVMISARRIRRDVQG